MARSLTQPNISKYKDKSFPKIYLRRDVLPEGMNDLLQIQSLFMDRWEIFAKLGVGAHGEVYAAYDRKLEKEVAIKACKDFKHFRSEIEIIKKLGDTENFCKFILEDSMNSPPYVVMDLMGPTLRQVLDKYVPLAYTTIMKLGLQMVTVIEKLHLKGFIHNDIKASNFVLGLPPLDWNNIYLVDYSLAKRVDISISCKTQNMKHNLNPNTNLGFVRNNCRRDDMRRLLNVFIQMRVELPLESDKDLLVTDDKRSKAEKLLMQHFGLEFVDFKSHLDKLPVYGVPNYRALKSAFNNLVESKGLNLSRKTEWEQNPHKLWKVTFVRNFEKGLNKRDLFPSKSVPVLPICSTDELAVSSILPTTTTKDQATGAIRSPSLDAIEGSAFPITEISSKYKIIQRAHPVTEHLLSPTTQFDKLSPSKAKLYPRRPTPQKMDTVNIRRTQRHYSNPENDRYPASSSLSRKNLTKSSK